MVPDMIQITEQIAADRVTVNTPYSLLQTQLWIVFMRNSSHSEIFFGEHGSRFAVKLDDDYGCWKF